MKLRAVFALNCCLLALPVVADTSLTSIASSDEATSNNTQNLVQYLENLGAYLGYPIKTTPPTPSSDLTHPNTTPILEALSLTTLFGATPVTIPPQMQGTANANTPSGFNFIPSGLTYNSNSIDGVNSLANKTFTNYATVNNGSQTLSATPLVDQTPYQGDPVTQSILNTISTVDNSYCISNNNSVTTQCSLNTADQIMSQVIGAIPSTQNLYASTSTLPLLAQLSSNTLLAPLLYSETATANTNPNQSGNPGLTAESQAQQAANFVRYATAQVVPITLPDYNVYDNLYAQSITAPNAQPTASQKKAQAQLTDYLTRLRVYAAQASIGIGNIYYILSKRLPQSIASGGQSGGISQSSQALSEYFMASWRIYNPMQPSNQWIAQINNASQATVQKEIAILLSEINYQMYLDRQIQERILLTLSVSQIQNTRSFPPVLKAMSSTTPSS